MASTRAHEEFLSIDRIDSQSVAVERTRRREPAARRAPVGTRDDRAERPHMKLASGQQARVIDRRRRRGRERDRAEKLTAPVANQAPRRSIVRALVRPGDIRHTSAGGGVENTRILLVDDDDRSSPLWGPRRRPNADAGSPPLRCTGRQRRQG